MIQTIFIYISVFVFCGLIAKRAQVSNNYKMVFLIIIILSVLAGIRADSVGMDSKGYAERFQLIVNNQIGYVWGIEKSFKLFMLIVSKIFKSYTVLFFICALITNLCVISRLWDFRNLTNFATCIAVYYIVFYFYSYNIMRQMCAVAIVFWGSRYIEKKKYVFFLLSIILGAIFHNSALFGALYLVSDIIEWKRLENKHKIIIVFGLLISPLPILYISNELMGYRNYLTNVQINLGIILFVKILFYVFSSIGLKQSIIRLENKENETEIKELSYKIYSVKLYYLIGLLINFTGYIFPVVNRISLYLYIYECVYMGMLMKYKKWKSGYPLFVIILYGLLFILMFLGGGQGQIPYVFFWQSK